MLSLCWARARLGDRQTGATEFQKALTAYITQGNKWCVPFYQGLLAEIEAEGEGAEGALTRIDEALALAGETGEHWTDALLHRLRGEILLKRDPANPAPAEEAFLTAIAVAQQQKAQSFELRAALALAKLYQSANRAADAHAVLAPALEGFSRTPEFPEIAEAQALLAALAETDEVKNAAAARQRRLKLQTSYGQAMMHVHGHGASETTAAFARAAELAARAKDAAEHFSARYGLWTSSYVRGEAPRGSWRWLFCATPSACLTHPKSWSGIGSWASALDLRATISALASISSRRFHPTTPSCIAPLRSATA